MTDLVCMLLQALPIFGAVVVIVLFVLAWIDLR